MGGGGQHPEQRHRPRRGPAAHPHSGRYNDHDDGGLDLPPLVSSPINGAWQLRPLRPTTFHRICTLVHPRLSPDHPMYAGSAPVAPLKTKGLPSGARLGRGRRGCLDYVAAMAADGVKDGPDCVETVMMYRQDVVQSMCSGDSGTDRQCRLSGHVRKIWVADGPYYG